MTEEQSYKISLKDGFTAPLKSIEGKMNSFEGTINKVGGAIAAAFAADRLISFGNESIRTAAKMNSLNNAIVFASGSSEEGATNLKFLSDISKEMGFNLESTTEGFKTFSGALIGSKFEGERGREIFRQLSTGISAMGLSADDAKGSFLAIGQMISKGTVSAEELRGQLGERLPGAFTIAAKSMGVTTAALGDMLKKGEVVTEDFLPNFAKEIEKTFGGGVDKASKGLQANLNRIENKFNALKTTIGNSFAPAIEFLAREEQTLNDKLETQKEFTSKLITEVNPLMDRYNQLTRNIFRTNAETEELSRITKSLGELMPSAVTAWDNYGNAIGISNEKLRENIKLSATKELELKKERRREIGTDIFKQTAAASQLLSSIRSFSQGTRTDEKDAIVADKREGLTAAITDLKTLVQTEQSLLGFSLGKTTKQTEEYFQKFGLGDVLKDILKEQLTTAQKGVFSQQGATVQTTGTSTTTSAAAQNKAAGLEKITSGTRNVTLNITKLVENISFVKDQSKNEQDMVEMVKRVLLTAVNDVNIVAQ